MKHKTGQPWACKEINLALKRRVFTGYIYSHHKKNVMSSWTCLVPHELFPVFMRSVPRFSLQVYELKAGKCVSNFWSLLPHAEQMRAFKCSSSALLDSSLGLSIAVSPSPTPPIPLAHTAHPLPLCWAAMPGTVWVALGDTSTAGAASRAPQSLTLLPCVQMLARGGSGAVGQNWRPHWGRGSWEGHGGGCPAAQLPAQVSTGPHEHPRLPPPPPPLPDHTSIPKAAWSLALSAVRERDCRTYRI